MADATFSEFLRSGKSLLTTTMQPRRAPVAAAKKSKSAAQPAPSNIPDDPHRIFVRKCVTEKPKAKDVVEGIKRFIDAAEAEL